MLEIIELQKLIPGLRRGSVVEIFGKPSCGKTGLMLSAAAGSTRRGEAVAIVDLCNSLDPSSARSAGLHLENLLWIRCCGRLEAAMKATDILLQGGGFELVILDAGNFRPQLLQKIPMMYWFRFRRAAESSRSALLILAPIPLAGSCSTGLIEVNSGGVRWEGTSGFRIAELLKSRLLIQKKAKFLKAGVAKSRDSAAPSIS
jgi:hypothetical protein